MEIFLIILFEYVLGYVIQGFTIVLGVYAFNRKKIDVKRYIFTSILVSIISSLVRLLPINFGIHTILNMIFLFLISILMLKMPAFNIMRSALLATLLLLVIEVVDVALMILIFGNEQFESMMVNAVNKAILGLPCTIVFAVVTVLTYVYLTKEKVINGENNGNIDEKNC